MDHMHCCRSVIAASCSRGAASGGRGDQTLQSRISEGVVGCALNLCLIRCIVSTSWGRCRANGRTSERFKVAKA